jgi:hypothetical protein
MISATKFGWQPGQAQGLCTFTHFYLKPGRCHQICEGYDNCWNSDENGNMGSSNEAGNVFFARLEDTRNFHSSVGAPSTMLAVSETSHKLLSLKQGEHGEINKLTRVKMAMARKLR